MLPLFISTLKIIIMNVEYVRNIIINIYLVIITPYNTKHVPFSNKV